MRYRLREIVAESKFCKELGVEAISRVLPKETIAAALEAEGLHTMRVRKMDLLVTILVVVGMNIYSHLSMGHVVQKIARGLRFIWPDPTYAVIRDSAFSYRRYQLGAQVMVRLFHQVCRPIATLETKGAFRFGLRLMAIDGTVENVPDTVANEAVFGRHSNGRAPAAFPQTQCVYLAECGTHVIVDAGCWPCHTSERVGGCVRSNLVCWSCGIGAFTSLTWSLLFSNVRPMSWAACQLM